MSSKKNSQQSSNDNSQMGEQQCCQQQQQPQQQQQQQQQQPSPPGVCKKEMAMMQLLAEQMKPPPLQINFKVGVPRTTKDRCSFEDEALPRDGRPSREDVDKMKKMNEGCPPMEVGPEKKPCDRKSS